VLRADAHFTRHARYERVSARARQGGLQAAAQHGGRSIFVLDQGDKNRNVVLETLTEYGTRYAIVQRYLPKS